ncbi:MAG: cupredoxin domain-containing protein, partial [Actinomycetota bacterium]
AAAAALAGCSPAAAGGPRVVEVTIRHSRFTPAVVDVRRGEEVTFVIRNTDPIDHEFILGDERVHLRHEEGDEPHHGAVPGEVSVAIGATASTTYAFTFGRPLEFACHLPGHYDYGMRGLVRVDR